LIAVNFQLFENRLTGRKMMKSLMQIIITLLIIGFLAFPKLAIVSVIMN